MHGSVACCTYMAMVAAQESVGPRSTSLARSAHQQGARRTLSMTRIHAMNSLGARGPQSFRGSEIVRNHNGFLAILVPLPAEL